MKKRNEIKRFFGLRPQNDRQRECITGNNSTCVALQGDISGLCKTSNKPTCVAPQGDRFCHPELRIASRGWRVLLRAFGSRKTRNCRYTRATKLISGSFQ